MWEEAFKKDMAAQHSIARRRIAWFGMCFSNHERSPFAVKLPTEADPKRSHCEEGATCAQDDFIEAGGRSNERYRRKRRKTLRFEEVGEL